MPKQVIPKSARQSSQSAKPAARKQSRPAKDTMTNLTEFASLTNATYFSNWCSFLLRGTLASKIIATPDLMMAPTYEIEETIIVDARSAWMRKGNKLLIFNGATLLSGKQSLADALSNKSDVTCIALLDGILHNIPAPPELPNLRYDTSTPRLQIGEHWQFLTLIGEVFVVPTWRGYSPAILVELKDGTLGHALVSAKSFFTGLEGARNQNGSLDRVKIKVRKNGPDKMAPYEVQVL